MFSLYCAGCFDSSNFYIEKKLWFTVKENEKQNRINKIEEKHKKKKNNFDGNPQTVDRHKTLLFLQN